MKKYWYICFRTSWRGPTKVASIEADHPIEWSIEMNNQWDDQYDVLFFSEITEKQHQLFQEEGT